MSETKAYLREWGSILAGLLLFAGSLPLYVSHTNRAILDRWSPEYVTLQLVVWAMVAVFAVSAWLKVGLLAPGKALATKQVFGVAILCWGLAYFLSALDAPGSAGRVTELNLFGSATPGVALLEWLSLLAGTVGLGVVLSGRLAKKWLNAAVILGAIAFAVLAGEGLLRAKATFWPEIQGFPTHSNELWYRIHTQTNSDGFRDIERSVQNTRDVRRILLIGDSVAFGAGIERLEDRYGEQLEAKLKQTQAGNWEVINASLGGSHTLDHIVFLERMLKYDPELVILLYNFNDIDYLMADAQAGSTKTGSSFAWKVLFVNSYLFQESYVRFRKLRFSVAPFLPSLHANESLLHRHFEDLEKFVSISDGSGAKALIVPFLSRLTEQDLAIYKRLLEGEERFGLPICNLPDAFEGYAAEELRVNSLDAHPNELAHGIAVGAGFDCVARALDAQPG